jgi:GDP-L-fucose synthase
VDAAARVYVAGHTGLLGSALCRALARRGVRDVITRTHAALDLTDGPAVARFFRRERPQLVFLAAARAGGIQRNRDEPAELLRVNLAIQTHVMHQAHRAGVRRLLFVGSGCAYPRQCPQPMRPDMLGTGPLEETSRAFATAKLAGIRMCQAYHAQYGDEFLVAIPATMYGPNDHFGPEGHVPAALLARCHAAKASGADRLTLWGTGRPRRQFLYADDAAEAMVLLMDGARGGEVVNVAAGADVSIAELAETVAAVVGFRGRIEPDAAKPDGAPQRLLDGRRIAELRWRPATPLAEGLARTYRWYCRHALTRRAPAGP